MPSTCSSQPCSLCPRDRVSGGGDGDTCLKTPRRGRWAVWRRLGVGVRPSTAAGEQHWEGQGGPHLPALCSLRARPAWAGRRWTPQPRTLRAAGLPGSGVRTSPRFAVSPRLPPGGGSLHGSVPWSWGSNQIFHPKETPWAKHPPTEHHRWRSEAKAKALGSCHVIE